MPSICIDLDKTIQKMQLVNDASSDECQIFCSLVRAAQTTSWEEFKDLVITSEELNSFGSQ